MRFLVGFKRVHPVVHRELGAGAGGQPGSCRKEQSHCTGCMDPASAPSETLEMEQFGMDLENSPAIFFISDAEQNPCTGCSDSSRAAPECKTVQRFFSFPESRNPDCNIKMPMSQSMHPVQGFCSDGSDSFTLCNDCAPLRIWIHMQIQIQMQIQTQGLP